MHTTKCYCLEHIKESHHHRQWWWSQELLLSFASIARKLNLLIHSVPNSKMTSNSGLIGSERNSSPSYAKYIGYLLIWTLSNSNRLSKKTSAYKRNTFLVNNRLHHRHQKSVFNVQWQLIVIETARVQ